MPSRKMPDINPVARLADLTLETTTHGKKYASDDAGLSEGLGLTQLGAAYSVVPPGKTSCPFHVHHMEDEMFVILEGEGTYRFGDREYQVEAGDVLGAPRGGAAYAHQLVNTGAQPLKYLSISSVSDTEVAEFPDSGKFMVYSRRSSDRPFRFVGKPSDGRDYFEGEE